MIDFNNKYDVNDLSPFCEHAEYVNQKDDYPIKRRVVCYTCNYIAFITVGYKVNILQSTDFEYGVWLFKDHTIIGTGSGLSKTLNYCLVNPPFELKELSSDIKKLMILL